MLHALRCGVPDHAPQRAITIALVAGHAEGRHARLATRATGQAGGAKPEENRGDLPLACSSWPLKSFSYTLPTQTRSSSLFTCVRYATAETLSVH